ncbi:hypothetical protein ARALYDRAFT_915320 [Arabidopsis lyrata subsp. lyrata]|uniref:Neprosin PEP catalytic domain-containing protein n=1 Tax=Arabidopsis lyrata subsp. lyrata TaxID=81972 RepID=D7MAY5_ARALL|nr:hypothetical protein ARALYDRAFT_915320 [Arabidopsis lyrata subsp. lyrata]
MESRHLSGEETVPASQDGSSLQVSGEPFFLSQNSDDFLAKEKDASLSDEDTLFSDFDEEEKLGNNEDSVQTEDVDVVEANNENDKKYELYLGMEFSSDESAYKAYRKYGANHGFDVRKQRGKDKKLKRVAYICSKEGFKQSGGKSCYNNNCDDGIIVIRHDFPLGMALPPSIRGDTKYGWWYQYGVKPVEIGLWPERRFQQSFGDFVEWGGEVYTASLPSPQMGYGYFPIQNIRYDAYIEQIAIFDDNYNIDRNLDYLEVFSDSNRDIE